MRLSSSATNAGWVALMCVVGVLLGGALGSQPASVQAGATTLVVNWNSVEGDGPAYYGVEYGWVDQDRQLFLERYHLLRPNVLRVQVTQELFEPANDNNDPNQSAINFNLTQPLDMQAGKTLTYRDMFTTLAAEFPSLHFHINMWLPARWNASSDNGYLGLGGTFPPQDWAEHREFVRELARWLVDTCGIAPQRLSFAFVNEPNLAPFFTGSPQDLAHLANETRQALDEVSPAIQLAGLDEVNGTSWSQAFQATQLPICCDFWTFHAYEQGQAALWDALEDRIDTLSAAGPVWVTEFANKRFGSPDAKMDFSAREAALSFADLGGRLWATEVEGIIHFRLADTFIEGPPASEPNQPHFAIEGGWAGHGLFSDWRGTLGRGDPYEMYPAFWVFANLFNQLGGAEVVSTRWSPQPSQVSVVAARHVEQKSLALWLTNLSDNPVTLQVQVVGAPAQAQSASLIDNLNGLYPVSALHTQSSDGKLSFEVTLAAQSSITVDVTTQAPTPMTPTPRPTGQPSATPTKMPPVQACTSVNCLLFIPHIQGLAVRNR